MTASLHDPQKKSPTPPGGDSPFKLAGGRAPKIVAKAGNGHNGANGDSVVVAMPEDEDSDIEMNQLRTALAEQTKRLMMLEAQLTSLACKRRSKLHSNSAPDAAQPQILTRQNSNSPFSRNTNDLGDLRMRPRHSFEGGDAHGAADDLTPSRRPSDEPFRIPSASSARGLKAKGGPNPKPSPPGTPPHYRPRGASESGVDSGQVGTNMPRPEGLRRAFDQDLLKTIYDKPYRQARKQGAWVGGAFLGLMSMPFGPIGMVGGGMFGALVGGSIGLWFDRRTVRRNLIDSEAEKRRLKSLVRWAIESFHEDDEFVALIEMVTLEFKPIADIANGSKHARKLLKLLDGWIANKKVTRHLWVYMDSLLRRWRDLNRADFMKSMRVFQTLTTMYRYSTRVLDEQEIEFLHRMERLLEHESVKLVMTHAEQNPTMHAARLMECIVYADALGRPVKRRNSLQSSPPASRLGDASPRDASSVQDEVSDESEDYEEPEFYQYTSTPKGIMMIPQLDKDGRASRQTSKGAISPCATPGSHQRQHSGSALGVPEVVVESPPQKQQMVLKKPFFKGWDDFLEFDCTFKHKMPITLSEFELLSQKDKEPLKGWDVCVDRKEIKVAKIQAGVGVITLRAWATVPGVDLTVAFFLFYNIEERVKWDKVFVRMDVIDSGLQGSDIIYSLMKVPAVTPRDFLQYRRVRVMDDGSIHIVLRSAEHPNMPDAKGVIRAESYISGYILTQSYDNDKPVLNIYLMTCVDIKGLIPKWIINATAPRKPAEWVETLRKAAIEYQNAHPNYKQELLKELEPFRETNPYDYEPAPVDSQAPSSMCGSGIATIGESTQETARFGYSDSPVSTTQLLTKDAQSEDFSSLSLGIRCAL